MSYGQEGGSITTVIQKDNPKPIGPSTIWNQIEQSVKKLPKSQLADYSSVTNVVGSLIERMNINAKNPSLVRGLVGYAELRYNEARVNGEFDPQAMRQEGPFISAFNAFNESLRFVSLNDGGLPLDQVRSDVGHHISELREIEGARAIQEINTRYGIDYKQLPLNGRRMYEDELDKINKRVTLDGLRMDMAAYDNKQDALLSQWHTSHQQQIKEEREKRMKAR